MNLDKQPPASFWNYFRVPFPKAEGFSAYRSPGLIVHLPVIGFSLLFGIWLCGADPWLRPFILLFAGMGIYLGRDLAIAAHYNPLLTLGVTIGWFTWITHPYFPHRVAPLAGAASVGVLAVLFAIYASWASDRMFGEAPPPATGRFPVLQRLVDRIDHAATLESDPAPVRLRKTLLIFLCAAGMLLGPWGARALAGMGLPAAATAAMAYGLLSLLTLLLAVLSKRARFAAWIQLTALLLAPFFIQWDMGGYAPSGAMFLWALLSPLFALVFVGTRWAVAWFAAFALLALGICVRDIDAGADQATLLLFCENTLLVSAVAFIALRFFILERDRAEARLLESLNRLFTRFDALCDRFGVEKIKTTGDAYMVCADLPEPRADHAETLARFALAMQEALDEHNRECGTAIQLRIGP